MHEKVKAYLEMKQTEEQARYKKEKQELLSSLGIVEKEYSNSVEPSAEYPNWGTDDAGKVNYYRNAVEITDEEYELLKKYSKKMIPAENKMAKILAYIAWAVIASGVHLGLILAEGGFLLFLIGVLSGGISGAFILGFAEVIKLLQAIKDK